jgi:hypothetical protein
MNMNVRDYRVFLAGVVWMGLRPDRFLAGHCLDARYR